MAINHASNEKGRILKHLLRNAMINPENLVMMEKSQAGRNEQMMHLKNEIGQTIRMRKVRNREK